MEQQYQIFLYVNVYKSVFAVTLETNIGIQQEELDRNVGWLVGWLLGSLNFARF